MIINCPTVSDLSVHLIPTGFRLPLAELTADITNHGASENLLELIRLPNWLLNGTPLVL